MNAMNNLYTGAHLSYRGRKNLAIVCTHTCISNWLHASWQKQIFKNILKAGEDCLLIKKSILTEDFRLNISCDQKLLIWTIFKGRAITATL